MEQQEIDQISAILEPDEWVDSRKQPLQVESNEIQAVASMSSAVSPRDTRQSRCVVVIIDGVFFSVSSHVQVMVVAHEIVFACLSKLRSARSSKSQDESLQVSSGPLAGTIWLEFCYDHRQDVRR